MNDVVEICQGIKQEVEAKMAVIMDWAEVPAAPAKKPPVREPGRDYDTPPSWEEVQEAKYQRLSKTLVQRQIAKQRVDQLLKLYYPKAPQEITNVIIEMRASSKLLEECRRIDAYLRMEYGSLPGGDGSGMWFEEANEHGGIMRARLLTDRHQISGVWSVCGPCASLRYGRATPRRLRKWLRDAVQTVQKS